MTWTDPTTRSVGDLITSSIWNTDLVNNLLYLHAGLPSCRVYNTANIAVTAYTLTLLTFNAERWDTDTIHDTTVNPGRLTCRTAGKYLIFANVEYNNSQGVLYEVRIRLNGATNIALMAEQGTSTPRYAVATIYDLVVGDYVEVLVYTAATSQVNAAANYSPEFGMHRIG